MGIMRKFVTRFIAASFALSTIVFAGAQQATANERVVRVASGLAGGTYRSVYAANLEKQLRDYTVRYLPSSGSGENLDLLATGKADLGFAQADVYAARLAAHPERYGDLLVLGRLADECVYIAYRSAGPVVALDQLGKPVGDRAARVAVGSKAGGASGTWSYLATLDPGLANASVDHTGDTLALNQLGVGKFDAVVWVTDPGNHDHKLLKTVVANNSLDLMRLNDASLVKPLADGTRIYETKTVKLNSSWNSPKLDTVCTSSMIFSRKDLDPRLLNTVSDIISLDLGRILDPEKRYGRPN
jgi:TRAP-type uncharacterized transport system substrate-binding protein